MSRWKPGAQTIVSAVLAGLLLFSGLAWQNVLAQSSPRPAGQPAARPEALSSTLSYYFIAGGTFTPGSGPFPYTRQVSDCVNQMPLGVHMLAPVHLPQASQVVSMTLFTYDAVPTTTFSTGYFNVSDAAGTAGYLLSADSDSGVIGYQHHQNVGGSPVTIDNQNYAYEVEWRKVPQEGDADSPYLSLCGIRLAYYAPLNALFLPALEK
jgi:hypothetical protein